MFAIQPTTLTMIGIAIVGTVPRAVIVTWFAALAVHMSCAAAAAAYSASVALSARPTKIFADAESPVTVTFCVYGPEPVHVVEREAV